MQRRGRAAFRQHRDILCARTDIRGRLTAYNALVRNAALWGPWGGETWPVHDTLLKQANHMQMGHLRQMLHINRKPGENWADWNKRSLRQARVQLHKQRATRLDFLGSLGPRGGRSPFYDHLEGPHMVARTARHGKQGGQAQTQIQQQPGRGKSTQQDRRGKVDAQRTGQRALETPYANPVEQHDVPWATGRQPKLENLTPTASPAGRGMRRMLADNSFN